MTDAIPSRVAPCGCTYHLEWRAASRDGGSEVVVIDKMCKRHTNAPRPPGYWGDGWTARGAATVAIARGEA
jgi:hypothetical protein